MTDVELQAPGKLPTGPQKRVRPGRSTVLYDELGPRGKRKVLIATVVLALAVIGFLVWFIIQLARFNHLNSARWSYIFAPSTLRYLGEGLLNNLIAAGIAGGITLIIGLFLALGRVSSNKLISRASVAWIEFFRGFPLLLLMVFPYLLFPIYFTALDPLWYVVIGLTLYNSAVMAEIYRAGINSLPRGQREAALAVGFRPRQAMRLIILPQAIRRMVPLLLTQLIILFKDSTLGTFITYQEALRRGELLGAFEPQVIFQSMIVTAIIFFLVSFTLSRLVALVERRMPKY